MTAILQLSGVSRDYGGLRPLRIEHLVLDAGGSLAILGLDQAAASAFLNLVTGATLPERGSVRLFGRSTADVRDGTEWLALLDRVGIVSARAVLLDALSVIQNVSMSFTLDVEPPPDAVVRRAEAIAAEAGLGPAAWGLAVGALEPGERMRVRLARALALDPLLAILEHPTAEVTPDGRTAGDAAGLGHDVRSVASARQLATLTLTADAAFARAVAARVVAHEPATGRLQVRRRPWFARRS